MTDLLLRIFVKDHKNYNDPEVRNKIGNFASWIGIILNILLVVIKVFAGAISNSISVIADGLNNLMDAVGSVITLIGFKLANKKADKEHPFGHGRYEYIAGLIVAVLILLVGLELGKTGIDKIINPSNVEYGLLTLTILVVSVFIKLWMAYFSNKLGKRINSTALIAVAVDSRNDVIATSAVFITALISRFANINLDGLAGLGVAVFIIYNGIILIKETISPIIGESPSQELVDNITNRIEVHKHILDVDDLIIHDYGPGKQYASAHVKMSSKIDPVYAHEYIDEIEDDVMEDLNVHLVIHYVPVDDDLEKDKNNSTDSSNINN